MDKVNAPEILVIEDDEDDIYIFKEGFSELGNKEVGFYTSALSAIEYLNSTDDEYLPKLIVTDFNLPAVNGFEFVKFLKNHVRLCEIPIVVVTTSMSVSNKKLFSTEGVLKIFIKPTKYEEFKALASMITNLADQT